MDRHDVGSYNLVVVGDFNFHVNDENDVDASHFLDILTAYNLTQCVSKRTQESGHTLDLIITRSLSKFVTNVTVEQKISDHFSVKCQLPIRRPHNDGKKEVRFRRLKTIDFDKLDSELSEKFEALDQSCDINSLVTSYTTISRNLIDKHAPEQKKSLLYVRNIKDLRMKLKKKRERGDG